MEVISNNLKELASKNYKYIEIVLGKLLDKNILGDEITNYIFDSRINKKQYFKILNILRQKFKKYNHNIIKHKIIYFFSTFLSGFWDVNLQKENIFPHFV